MTDTVSVAAVGLGRWANVLAEQYTKLDNIDLVTCFTRTAETREEFAEEWGCDAEESLDAVLDRDDIDALVITVPNDFHADVIEQAADAGKHCFVEKPISINVADAKRIEDAVDRNDITFLCGHSCRRVGGIRKMKELIDEEDVGQVSHIEAEWANERGLEIGPDNWRGDPEKAPGGPLIQLGVHQIDNLQYLLGPVKQVFTFGKPMYTEVENMTMTQTVLEFEDGKQAYLGANWTSPGVFFINVYGTEGVMFYDMDFSNWSNSEDTDKNSTLVKREFEEWTDDPDNRQLRDVDIEMPINNHLRDEFDEFARAITEDDVEPEIGARAAMRNVAVVKAAQTSARENRPVTVEEIIENA
ncbi:Gfo/Idh/MocA family protein [Halomicroarcula sp. GCM10025324]|uniref:Gfo/Idh/MocA family protein n=1 Tax=Haloarcula TaxID=2237 RepID=UPI0023E7D608|nr:Gfo/Idh/MocA family oxidoreductase [Halomicroarcula sp. ZS-22-S1]